MLCIVVHFAQASYRKDIMKRWYITAPLVMYQSAESSKIILFSAKTRLLEAKVDPSPMATQHRQSIWIKAT